MKEPSTHTYEDYEAYDGPQGYEDDEDLRPEPVILWGRIAILGAAIVAAFVIGRWSAPAGVPPERLERIEKDLAAARADGVELRGQLEAERARRAAAEDDVAEEPAEETPTGAATAGSDSDAGADTADPKLYVVKDGDTLRAIAKRFYNDFSYESCIARANGITDPKKLRVGDKLEIPPSADC